jgi:predicted DCC family thiol-disulfide oxidoreductase YuxK
MTTDNKNNIVFFDGFCGLCDHLVNFLISRDHHNLLFFAPLQGVTAKANLNETDLKEIDTLIYLENGVFYKRSDAVLRSVSKLGSFWKIILIFLIIPRFLRDWVYSFVASNRYKWFSKRESCRMPNKDERARILP